MFYWRFSKYFVNLSSLTLTFMSDRYFNPEDGFEVNERRLPHWTQDGKIYFVTFRLADSLPQSKILQLKMEREEWMKNNSKPYTKEQILQYDLLFNERVENWIDAGHGECVLKREDTSLIVNNSLQFFDHKRYFLHSYVIMSNHVHLIIEPVNGYELKEILHSVKSYSATEINKILHRHGRLWAIESYDRLIRDALHYRYVEGYIVKNIKMGGIRWSARGIPSS